MHSAASHFAHEPHAPWLASLPLDPSYGEQALLIVHAGRAVAPPEGLGEVLRFQADGQGGWIAAARTASGRWGYVDAEGRWRKPPTLQKAAPFSSDGLAGFCDGGRWGFVDLAGQVVIPPRFDHVHPFRHGVCSAQTGKNAWCIVDRQGAPVCAEPFAELGPWDACGLASAAPAQGAGQPRTYGFVDRCGHWVIAPRFHSVRSFGEGDAAAASLDGLRFGLIDTAGHWVLEPRYARIDDFNAEGLAFFSEPGAWDAGYGYLDTRGRVVVRGGRHLSRHMACGVVAHSDHGAHFLTSSGATLPGPPWSYGTDFSAEWGFAVVRSAPPPGAGHAPPGTQSASGGWGLLHPDGRWVRAPAHLLEPLTDGEGGLVRAQPGTPLVPFITRDGQMAFVDGEGAEVWRAHYDGQQVALLDAHGAVLWRSGVRSDCWPPRPFFQPPLTDHLEGLQALQGIVPLAQRLLAAAQAAPGADGSNAGGGTRSRVLHAYLSASHREPYPFLAADLQAAADGARAALVQHLAARFGAPVPPPADAPGLQHVAGDVAGAWTVPADPRGPGPAPQGTAPAQWLVISACTQSCDGDTWWELWLAAGPVYDTPPPRGPTGGHTAPAAMTAHRTVAAQPEGRALQLEPARAPRSPWRALRATVARALAGRLLYRRLYQPLYQRLCRRMGWNSRPGEIASPRS